MFTIHESLMLGGFIGPMEQVRAALPGVPQIMFRQNPQQNNENMASVVLGVDKVAGLYGDMAVVDAYTDFIQAGRTGDLYSDFVHPSELGQTFFMNRLTDAWISATPGEFTARAGFLSETGTNLLTGANFGAASYVGGTPAGWTVVGSGNTATVETGIVAPGKVQSMKIAGTGGGGFYFQVPNPANYIGQQLSLAVRVYIPGAAASTAGRIALYYAGSSTLTVTSLGEGDDGPDGWRWLVIAGLPIPTGTTAIRAYIYRDSAASADLSTYFDEAVAVVGPTPKRAS